MVKKEAFEWFDEFKITFPPTFKFDPFTRFYDSSLRILRPLLPS